MKDSLSEVQSMLNRPITDTTDITSYISELCGNVTSCALFVDFIGKDEPRYQRLFTVFIIDECNYIVSGRISCSWRVE